MADRKTSECQSDESVMRTGGKVFSDGSILELIRIPNGELSFLIWNGKSAKTAEQFMRRGETFAPLRCRSHNPALATAPEQNEGIRIDPQAVRRNFRLDLADPGGRRRCEGSELLRLRDLVGRRPPCSAFPLDRRTADSRGRDLSSRSFICFAVALWS